jgi:hypothetical protein
MAEASGSRKQPLDDGNPTQATTEQRVIPARVSLLLRDDRIIPIQ